MILISSKLE